jgi:hypothetical protein
MKILKTKRSFRQEFKRQIRLAVVAAIGFLIAFAWRDAILELSRNFVARLLDVTPQHYLTATYSAIFLTLIGVFLILISSKLLRER